MKAVQVDLSTASSSHKLPQIVEINAGAGQDFDSSGGTINQLLDERGSFGSGVLLTAGKDTRDAEIDKFL